MTVPYTVYWYGAGAAHPNQHYATHSFMLQPVIPISSLAAVFGHAGQALSVIQRESRSQLARALVEGDPERDVPPLDLSWIEGGTEDWDSFSAFVFGPEEIELLFGPYQVAPYAWGPQAARVPYDVLIEVMLPEYRSALGL